MRLLVFRCNLTPILLFVLFTRISAINAISTIQATAESMQNNIIFPNEYQPSIAAVPTKPKCVQTIDNLCTEVKNYPIKLLETILRSDASKYEQLFGDDLLSSPIKNRFDESPDEELLCTSQERVIYPQGGFTKDNVWRIIVNLKNFTQGIRVEECVQAGLPCAMSENFPNGYTTECKQKYIYRQLLSLTDDGIVSKDLFKLPSCCKCSLSMSYW